MVKRKKSYIKKINQLDTLSVHAGVKTDPLTGAVMTPIYATSTYAHDKPGEHKGYEYSRSQNPTREVLENSIAELESGYKAFAFASLNPELKSLILICSNKGPLICSKLSSVKSPSILDDA